MNAAVYTLVGGSQWILIVIWAEVEGQVNMRGSNTDSLYTNMAILLL